MTKAKRPKKDVTITFSITETASGLLRLTANVPDGANGSLALLLADKTMAFMREAMRETTGQKPPMTETRLQ